MRIMAGCYDFWLHVRRQFLSRLPGMSGAALAISLFFFGALSGAVAQDVIGFPLEDFGKVVLVKRQVAGGDAGRFDNYRNEPIGKYDRRSVFYRLGGPVGRLDIRTNTRSFPCTGFLISKKYLMTNYHCVPGIVDLLEVRQTGARRIELIQFLLGYTQEGVEEVGRRFSVAVKPVEANKALDYSILEVSGNPAKAYGWLKLASAEPTANSPLWIIGHPLGEAQRISREQCMSSGPPVISGGQLRHTCDTLPGNSGSPVLDPDTKRVLALHHAGSSSSSINYAIPMARIIAASPVLKALLAEQEKHPEVVAAGDPLRNAPFPKAQDDPKLIAYLMQLQLQRGGCYPGKIDGVWGPASEASIAALPSAHRIRLTPPTISSANAKILREIEPGTCGPRQAPTKTVVINRNPPAGPRPRRGSSSTCIQRAQRYCSNPDNSSAIGYAACLTQAKAGCRE